MSFTEWDSEGSNGLIADLVFKTVFNVTTGRTTFAADTRAETITVLYSKSREGSLNITCRSVLRKGEESRSRIRCAWFEFGTAQFEHKAFGISIRSRAWQGTSTADPCGITCIPRKIIRHVCTRRYSGSAWRDGGRRRIGRTTGRNGWTRHNDIHPPGLVRISANAKESAIRVLEHPKTAIRTGCRRRGHIDRNINSLTDRYILREGCRRWRAQLRSTREYQLIRRVPGAGTDILQTPCLGECCTRVHHGAIRDSHIRNELCTITSRRRNSYGAWRDCWATRRDRWRSASTADNDWIAPYGAVTNRRTPCRHIKNELYTLSSQCAQIKIRIICPSLKFFAERPEGADRAAHLIVKTVSDIAGGCSSLTAYCGLEPITALNGKVWVDRLNISIRDLMGRKEQSGLWGNYSTLKIGFIQFQGKPFCIAIGAREGKSTCAAGPGCLTSSCGEVKCNTRGGCTGDIDLYPPGPVCVHTNAKQGTCRILEFPVSDVMTRCIWRRHIHRQVNGPARCHAGCEIDRSGGTHSLPSVKHHGVRVRPGTRADVP